MMGLQCSDQARLFYEFCLEDRVPADHLLRKIDRFLDLSTLRRELAPFYRSTGRPSIDPELLIRMLIVGYCFGIRSERRLCEKVDLNLAYRWFCRLGLDGDIPDHSTFSKTRHGRFRDSDAFRHLFEMVMQRAITEGLVGDEGFAVDASLIAADANKQRSFASTDKVDWQELAMARRSVREYLDTLDDAAWGAASEIVPKFISPSDPAAQWTGAHKGHAFFAYADNYLIDLKAAIIVEYVAVEARNLAPLPGDVDFTVGASVAMPGLTAWQGLFEHGRLQAGQSVLVHGAAGAVGSMVTQLAREFGAYVIGAGRAADRQKALDFCAQEFVDLENDVLEDVGGVDLVFDVIGGDIGKRSACLIRAGGTVVTIAGPTEARPADGLAIDFVLVSDRAQLSEIIQRVRDGRLRTNIGNVSTLDDAVAALNPTDRVTGKTIIRIRP